MTPSLKCLRHKKDHDQVGNQELQLDASVVTRSGKTKDQLYENHQRECEERQEFRRDYNLLGLPAVLLDGPKYQKKGGADFKHRL